MVVGNSVPREPVVETRRWKGISKENRICNFCNSVIGDGRQIDF
jgi:hypothetical protein